jgi:hypothetical protein
MATPKQQQNQKVAKTPGRDAPGGLTVYVSRAIILAELTKQKQSVPKLPPFSIPCWRKR